MTRTTMIRTTCLLCGSLLLAACASTGTSDDASAFPVGKYRNGDTVAIFNADGTFVGTTTEGEDWVKGTYAATGKEFTMQDTWEGEALVKQMGKSYMGIEGRYTWALEADVLTATVVEDACEGRVKGTSGVPWTRMP